MRSSSEDIGRVDGQFKYDQAVFFAPVTSPGEGFRSRAAASGHSSIDLLDSSQTKRGPSDHAPAAPRGRPHLNAQMRVPKQSCTLGSNDICSLYSMLHPYRPPSGRCPEELAQDDHSDFRSGRATVANAGVRTTSLRSCDAFSTRDQKSCSQVASRRFKHKV